MRTAHTYWRQSAPARPIIFGVRSINQRRIVKGLSAAAYLTAGGCFVYADLVHGAATIHCVLGVAYLLLSTTIISELRAASRTREKRP